MFLFVYYITARPNILAQNQPFIHQRLEGLDYAEFTVRPGQSALEISGIGLAKRPICGKLDRGTRYERTGCHDDLGIIAGHIPRLGSKGRIHGSRSLNALTEGNESLGLTEGDGLDDVVSVFF